MAPIRVLVAEDSLTVRKRLVEVLSEDPDVEVVGEAADGAEAIELCQRLRPDVLTLDIVMPVLHGLAVTEHVMAYFPTPILIVSSTQNRGDAFRTYDALGAGALDVLEKPSEDDAFGDSWERKLVSTVKLVSRIKVIRHLRARFEPEARAPAEAPALADFSAREPRLVAIGASTGGPSAVADLLRALPSDFRLPVLLVIHISPAFSDGLNEWLHAQSPLPVVYAREGEPLPPPGRGRVFLAPPDRHLVLSGDRLRLTSDPERHSCRPAVDVLFESVAQSAGTRSVACLLTGMGRDGAQGLLAIRRAGGMTLAQDEATSVVFGMPKEAIALGAADRVLPLNQMAPLLSALSRAGVRGPR